MSGFKYDDTKLAEGRPITRTDLDEAVPDHPAMVGHRGGHTGVYNSKAFQMAGVTAQTPDPEGGKFYREDGELTGKVAEHARGAFNGVGKYEEITRETRQKGIAHISKLMTAAGLTSVHRTGTDTEGMIAFEDAYKADEMRFRMYAFPSGGSELFSGLKMAGLRTGFGDEWLRIGAVKYAADGSASERTMSMSTPYVGRPDDYGILTMTQEEIDAAVQDAHENGFQIGIHANGDVAIEMVLNAYEKYLSPSERPRIEHATLVNPALLERMKEAGVIPTPVLDLRLLPRRKVGGVRGGQGTLDVPPQLVSGVRDPGGRRLRLHAGPVRADDGAPEQWSRAETTRDGCGDRTSASAWRKRYASARSTAPMPPSKRISRGRSLRASWRISSSWAPIRTTPTRTPSRTFRSYEPWSAARRCTRHRAVSTRSSAVSSRRKAWPR